MTFTKRRFHPPGFIACMALLLFLLSSPPPLAAAAKKKSSKNKKTDKPTPASAPPVVRKKKNYLVLGGTGSRSAATTEFLIRQPNVDVVLLNRGNMYWDVAKELNVRAAEHWPCDRKKKLQNCKPFMASDRKFDACLDFSSLTWEQLQNAKDYLLDSQKCDFYLFASSYKVYEVSGALPKRMTKKWWNDVENGRLQEDKHMRRPNKSVSPLERHEIISANKIGNDFYEVEEALEKNFMKTNVPYSVLRIGNVITPKEATMRFWFLQLWLHGHQNLGMPMHTTSDAPMSFTYGYDIAQAVAKVLKKAANATEIDEVAGEAFNIACEETKDQYNLYYTIGDAIGLSQVQHVRRDNRTEALTLYPENKDGHVMNIEKAKRILGFKPTNLDKAIRESALFYEQALTGERWKNQRKVAFNAIAEMMRTRKLVDWVEKKVKEKKNIYDDYDPEEYEEYLQDKFKRLEL
ncbi:unnamed protein product [Amoebophrya sp. A120]|nr:unnamed protein product [Amoebophrya sp. A120]|eukprot:GSA120T00024503001.1